MGIHSENGFQRHQLNVDQYYQMAQIGLLSPNDRVELIEGEIIDRAPIGSAHSSTVRTLAELFSDALSKSVIIAIQDPIRLDGYSEPVPDFAQLRRRDDQYRHEHPSASDVLLIVEVSQTSLRYDFEVKLPLYAKHGIPEVWIVDVDGGQIHTFNDLRDGQFTNELSTQQLGKLKLIALPDVEINLSGLF